MQHERDMLAPIRKDTLENLWEQTELEFGPFDSKFFTDEDVKNAVKLAAFGAKVRGESVRVPPVIAERVLTELLRRCRLTASAGDKPALARANQLLKKVRACIRTLSPRPAHRPKKDWYLKLGERIACVELEQRRRELMYQDLSRDDAIWEAAEEIALPGYKVSPATLISWWANPGRRRRK